MDDSSVYADSAQAREMDRRAGQQLDYWGNPIRSPAEAFHNYDTAARAADEAEYRKGLAKRISIAIGQMELVCPPHQPINDGALHGAQGAEMSQSQDLVILPEKEVALKVFSTPNGLDPYLQSVRDELDRFIASAPDVKTKKGQGAYRSIAYDLATSKTKLDNLGKDLVAELKDIPKKIDAERKRVRELLADWQEEVRKPLTDWEAAEAARKKGHNDSIQWLQGLVDGVAELPADQIAKRIEEAEAFVIGEHLEEFKVESARAKDGALSKLRTSLDARLKHEAELAEIAKFNAEKAAREKAEHEAAIAREATERAQREADQRAEAEREAAANRELQLKLQAEQAERAAAQEKADRLAAEQRAEQDRIAAEKRQAEAVEQARLDEVARANAAADEVNRQAAAREADKEHKKTICLTAQQAMVAAGIAEDVAKAVIILIHQRRISAISIAY